MQWQDVAKIIAPAAPFLGGVLGGFIPIPGAGFALTKVGEMIAQQFGVAPTPDAVAGAIKANPNEVVLAKLQAATEEARAMWPAWAEAEKAWAVAAAATTAAVNVTMQAELLNRDLYHTGWRPACGWIFAVYALVFGALLSWSAALAAFVGKPEALKVMAESWPIFLAYFGALAAMVGVLVVGRSYEKATAIDRGVPTTKPEPKK